MYLWWYELFGVVSLPTSGRSSLLPDITLVRQSERSSSPSHVPWHIVLHPGILWVFPVGFKPWEVPKWGKQCQKKTAELLGWILASEAGSVVLWQWLHAVQGWDSKSLKSLKTPWTLVPLCAVLPLCDHSISTPFWPLGTHLGCVLSGFWLCTNHRHAFPETNKQKKKKWNIYAIISTGISSPQRHEHTGAKNWSRYFLSFFSQHSPLLCYGSSIFHMSKHHKEAFQLLPNPWNQLSMLHPIPTPSLVLPVVSSWLDDTCVLLNRL